MNVCIWRVRPRGLRILRYWHPRRLTLSCNPPVYAWMWFVWAPR